MDDFARLIGAFAVVLLLAACADGYPAEDHPRTAAMSVNDHMRALNRHLDAQVGNARDAFELASPCMLVLHDASPGKPTRRQPIDLRTLAVELRADKEAGRYAVALLHGAEAPPRAREGFDVEGWVDAVAFRSHLQQLQISCIDEAGGASAASAARAS